MNTDTAVSYETTYFPWADEIFFSEDWENLRYKVISKGRRLGFTKSTAQYLIESMLGSNELGVWDNKKEDEGIYILWGDTTHSNIRRYYQRYFKPVLDNIERKIKNKVKDFKLYEYKTQDSMLIVYNGKKKSIIDFRSADKPENWEGFGYDIIVLNEAGIILKNKDLWEHSVAPMMLDNPKSKAIIGGVPKGKNLFFELWKRGVSKNYPRWKNYKYSSYDNPLLSEEDIEELTRGMSEKAIRQEIFGEFVDDVANEMFSYDEVERAMRIEVPPSVGSIVWGIDIARHGDDLSVIAKRKGKFFYEPLQTLDIQDTMKLAEWIYFEYQQTPDSWKPEALFLDTTAGSLGWGVHDRLKQLGLPVMPVDFSAKSMMKGILNKRAEMYERLKEEHIKQGGNLPKDNELLFELINTEYEYTDKGLKKLISKEKIKEQIGRSPDRADAVALTYAQPFDEILIRKQKTKRIRKKFKAGV